jgi:WD40 repeat protein
MLAATTKSSAAPLSMAESSVDAATVVAGTYEGNLIGWEFLSRGGEWHVHIPFAFSAHPTVIRQVTVAPKAGLLVTASADETAKVFDLGRKRGLGELTKHSGECGASAETTIHPASCCS